MLNCHYPGPIPDGERFPEGFQEARAQSFGNGKFEKSEQVLRAGNLPFIVQNLPFPIPTLVDLRRGFAV